MATLDEAVDGASVTETNAQPGEAPPGGQSSNTPSAENNITKPERCLSDEELEEIRTSFSMIDENGDGKITLEELQHAAYYLGMNPTEEEARAMLKEADLDNDGCIDFEEYKAMMMDNYISVDMERERMIAAFRTLDKDGDGYISIDELKMALMFKDPTNLYPSTDDRNLMTFLKDADENGDGMIDYVEFVTSKLCSKVF